VCVCVCVCVMAEILVPRQLRERVYEGRTRMPHTLRAHTLVA
jgi:hypothetical protein